MSQEDAGAARRDGKGGPLLWQIKDLVKAVRFMPKELHETLI